jgi:hypothetical protein
MLEVNRHGFNQTAYGLYIQKDVEAVLTYTFDWSQWLQDGDTIKTVEYTANARRNDPTPVEVVGFGRDMSHTQTYVELSNGQENKTYVITAKIETENGLIDRRSFRIGVVDRSA